MLITELFPVYRKLFYNFYCLQDIIVHSLLCKGNCYTLFTVKRNLGFHPFCCYGIFLSIILVSWDPKVSIMRNQWYQNYGHTGFWWCLLLGQMMLKWCFKKPAKIRINKAKMLNQNSSTLNPQDAKMFPKTHQIQITWVMKDVKS